jgi:hypothetical protein
VGSPFSGEGPARRGPPSTRPDCGLPLGTALALRCCREVLRRGWRVDPVGRHRPSRGERARLLAFGRYCARGHARAVRGSCHLPPGARARGRSARRMAACAGRVPVRTRDEHALPRRLLRPLRGAQLSVRGAGLRPGSTGPRSRRPPAARRRRAGATG